MSCLYFFVVYTLTRNRYDQWDAIQVNTIYIRHSEDNSCIFGGKTPLEFNNLSKFLSKHDFEPHRNVLPRCMTKNEIHFLLCRLDEVKEICNESSLVRLSPSEAACRQHVLLTYKYLNIQSYSNSSHSL